MIRHLFKLNWNRKSSNLLILIEIFFSFLILFAIFSMAIENLQQYLKPLGFDCHHVWLLEPDFNQREAVNATLKQIKSTLSVAPEIKVIAFSETNLPYTANSRQSQFEFGTRKASPHRFIVDDDYKSVLGIQIAEGRWFDERDVVGQQIPAVINREMQQQLFGEENPLSKTIIRYKTEYRIVGVIEQFRYQGEFFPDLPSIFERNPLDGPGSTPQCILIKVRPGTDIHFEEKLVEKLSGLAPGWTWNIKRLESMRKDYFISSLLPIILLSIVCGFLILNIALGLFGVLWNSIHQRRSELGIRRAVGAWSRNIYQQITGEVLVLATLGIIAGNFFAVQFPLLNIFNVASNVYLWAILLATVVIYLFVTICALFPSYLATQIQPVEALHEE